MINQSSSFIKGHCWCKFQLYTIFRFEILKEFSQRKINPYWSWNFRKKQANNGWIRSNSSDNWDVWEKNDFMYQLFLFLPVLLFCCCCCWGCCWSMNALAFSFSISTFLSQILDIEESFMIFTFDTSLPSWKTFYSSGTP